MTWHELPAARMPSFVGARVWLDPTDYVYIDVPETPTLPTECGDQYLIIEVNK